MTTYSRTVYGIACALLLLGLLCPWQECAGWGRRVFGREPSREVKLPPVPADPIVPPVPATLPDDVQLTGVPSVEVGQGIEDLVRWPDKDRQHLKAAKLDRSKEFPAKTQPKTGRVQVAGAVSPEEAVSEAAYWVTRVLRREYVPARLKTSLLTLSAENPAKSTVFVRYEIKGYAIQVSQMRWIECIVIKPNWKDSDEPMAHLAKSDAEREAFVKRIIAETMIEGEQLADIPLMVKKFPAERDKIDGPEIRANDKTIPNSVATTLDKPHEDSTFFVVDLKAWANGKDTVPTRRWIAMHTVSTDGRVVCIWLKKQWPLNPGSHSWTSAEPWF